ncbi:MAG: ATP-dependent protease [Acidobacteria bacterium]|nr:ATP-dependent protease [Acidobacteriota bacterium]|tara:strand:+ start:338 stop:961 length:624 start_codon:yes stop_codon:yes gene_type:complete
MLPSIIPIFPLPNVVLFPSVFLPLHIFEPRYRQMLADALQGDRIIGMVLLRERDAIEEAPPVYAVGCAGLVSHSETLQDGRSNIILRGIQRFRIALEETDRAYRRAHIAPLPEEATDEIREDVRQSRTRLATLLAGRLETASGEAMVPNDMGDEELVNTLAQYLDFDPIEKQALLERDDIASRSRALIDLIEMRSLAGRSPGGFGPQ